MRLKNLLKKIRYEQKVLFKRRLPTFSKSTGKVEDDWARGATKVKSRFSLSYIIFFFSLLFLIVSVAIAGFTYIFDINRTISTSKVDIVVQGSKFVNSADLANLSFSIVNRNPVTIKDLSLTVEYPPGSFERKSNSIESVRQKRVVIGDIESGDFVEKKLQAIFFGEAGEEKEMSLKLEYGIAGSTSLFQTEQDYSVIVRKSPIILGEPSFTNPVSGKEVRFSFKLTSNTDEPINSAYIKADYPKGFTPSSSVPKFLNNDNNVWLIENLRPNETRQVTVSGGIRGEHGTVQSILVYAYVSPSDDGSVLVAKESVEFEVEKPFVDVRLELDGEYTDNLIVSPGETVSGSLNIENQYNDVLKDLSIILSITGNGLDVASIRSGSGSYNPNFGTIVWDKITNNSLSNFSSNADEEFEFSFKTLPSIPEISQTQREVVISVSASSKRAGFSDTDFIRDILVSTVKTRSAVQISNATLYETGKLRNTGPIPPKVGETTTYSLSYLIRNDGNDLEDVEFKIPLRKDVKWLARVIDARPNEVFYDKENHTVYWRVKRVSANGTDALRRLEFQVSIVPSENQVGEKIFFTREASFSAKDVFVDEVQTKVVRELDSQLSIEGKRDSSFVIK